MVVFESTFESTWGTAGCDAHLQWDSHGFGWSPLRGYRVLLLHAGPNTQFGFSPSTHLAECNHGFKR